MADPHGARRFPVVLLAAVLAVACGSCVVHAVRVVRAVPDWFPTDSGTYAGHGPGGPGRGPARSCPPTDPTVAGELNGDPLIATAPPGATTHQLATLENCEGDGGGVGSIVNGAPTTVIAHYQALLAAGGWVLSDPPPAGTLLSATRAWRDRSLYFSVKAYAEVFLVKITIVRR